MYSLVVAKNGPKMQESPDAPTLTQSGVDTAQPSPSATSVRTVAAGGRVRITAQHETMRDLADHLTRQLDRPVKDETGMSRTYDFVLTFSSNELAGTPNPSGTTPPATPADGPPRSLSSDLPNAQELSDLFGAVQSQLGLKLEAKKGMLEVLVVDHVERPSEN